jgi:DNA-binding NarL/FixJ family response regulator
MLCLLLVEDHILFRDALALTLNRQPNLEVAGQCGSLAECRSLADAFAVSVGVAWLDLTSFEQYAWFSFVGAVAATVRCLPGLKL